MADQQQPQPNDMQQLYQQLSLLIFEQSMKVGRTLVQANPTLARNLVQSAAQRPSAFSMSAIPNPVATTPHQLPFYQPLPSQQQSQPDHQHHDTKYPILSAALSTPPSLPSRSMDFSASLPARSFKEEGVYRKEIFVNRDTKTLRDWFEGNIGYPYPNSLEIMRLSRETGLTHKQIQNWFCYARRRYEKLCVGPLPWIKKRNRYHGDFNDSQQSTPR